MHYIVIRCARRFSSFVGHRCCRRPLGERKAQDQETERQSTQRFRIFVLHGCYLHNQNIIQFAKFTLIRVPKRILLMPREQIV